MDATLDWKISPKADGLVDTLAKVKQELTNVCFKMNGAAKALTCNAYASEKVVELLKFSEMWKPIENPEDDRPTDSQGRHFNAIDIPVADMGFFKLYIANVMGDEQVRLVVTFDIGIPEGRTTNAEQKLFGNVRLI